MTHKRVVPMFIDSSSKETKKKQHPNAIVVFATLRARHRWRVRKYEASNFALPPPFQTCCGAFTFFVPKIAYRMNVVDALIVKSKLLMTKYCRARRFSIRLGPCTA
jgi:hypothetical protein